MPRSFLFGVHHTLGAYDEIRPKLDAALAKHKPAAVLVELSDPQVAYLSMISPATEKSLSSERMNEFYRISGLQPRNLVDHMQIADFIEFYRRVIHQCKDRGFEVKGLESPQLVKRVFLGEESPQLNEEREHVWTEKLKINPNSMAVAGGKHVSPMKRKIVLAGQLPHVAFRPHVLNAVENVGNSIADFATNLRSTMTRK